MNKIIAIGCGGAGNILLNALATETNVLSDVESSSLYYNTTSADLLSSFIGKKLILNGDGTGRNKKVGSEIAKQNIVGILDHVDTFYKKNTKLLRKDDTMDILVISSFGGGSGSSVVPVIIDFLKEIKGENVRVSLIGIFSSSKEGVSTIPNCVKTFNELYNDFVLTEKLDNFIVFDNEKFEIDYELETFDYDGINSVIVQNIESIFLDKSSIKTNSGGMQALDANERRRVLNWGKGVADYITTEVTNFTDPIEFESSIFNGKYKFASAKAVYLKINFASSRDKVRQDTIDETNILIGTVRKLFKNAFFVFGYEFDSVRTTGMSVDIYMNGMDFPKQIEADAKKAMKTVTKLKEKNKAIEIQQDALEF